MPRDPSTPSHEQDRQHTNTANWPELRLIDTERDDDLEQGLPLAKPSTLQLVSRGLSSSFLLAIITWAPTFTTGIFALSECAKIQALEEGSFNQLLVNSIIAPWMFEAAKLWLNNSNVLAEPMKHQPVTTMAQTAASVAWFLTYFFALKKDEHTPLAQNLAVTSMTVLMKLYSELLDPYIKKTSSTHLPLHNQAGEDGQENERVNLPIFKTGDLVLLICAVIGMGAVLGPYLEPELFAINIKTPAAGIAVSLLINAALGDLFFTHSGYAKFPAENRNSKTIAAHDAFTITTKTLSIAITAELASLSPFQSSNLASILLYCIGTYLVFEVALPLLVIEPLSEKGYIWSCDKTVEKFDNILSSCKSQLHPTTSPDGDGRTPLLPEDSANNSSSLTSSFDA